LEIKLPEEGEMDTPLRVNFIGIREDAMYPAKEADAKKRSPDGILKHPMDFLERLNDYLEKESNGAVDSLLLGCVAGVVDI
jgi:hypothetical protein